jgi:ABC-type nitrate/sulfonate/bicarbonate transport system substrate-binding protein
LNKKPIQSLIATATVMVVALLVTACSTTNQAVSTAKPADKIRVQLSWLHTIEFAGFYMAQDKGYYKDQNLDVELRSGGYDDQGNYIDPLEQVVSGKADFSILDGTTLLSARADGKPVVAIAAIYLRHPLALISLADKNITKPADLVGPKLQISGVSTVIFQALLRSENLDASKINVVERTDFTSAPLLDGSADVIDGWVTNEAVDLTESGQKINMILVSDYGIDVYPDVIVTTEDRIKNDPDLVQRFVSATLHGTESAIDDPESSAKLSVSYDSSLDLKKETTAMQQSLPLLLPAGSKVGMMDPKVWEFTQQVLLDEGILKESVDLNAAYTLNFLNAYYQSK